MRIKTLLKHEITDWDVRLRVFHWLLVIAVTLCLLTGLLGETVFVSRLLSELGIELMELHFFAGLSVSLLLLYRLALGFYGSEHLLFTVTFKKIFYWKVYMSDNVRVSGHRPPAALAVVTMIVVLSMQALSGWFSMSEDEQYYAPLSYWISESLQYRLTSWHLFIADLIVALIILHVTALMMVEVFENKRIIKSMIRKGDKL